MKIDVCVFEDTSYADGCYNSSAAGRNKDMLADGVKGLKCTEVRKTLPSEWAIIREAVPNASSGGGVEVYEDGSMNLFFRIHTDNATGFVRVRPDTFVPTPKELPC